MRASGLRFAERGFFFLLFTIPLILLHLGLLHLPYFWDELGQFIPTALDLLRDGSWVAHSTLPNIHPPGVEVYLVLWYKLFGYSTAITRLAMLCLAGVGLLLTFLLAVRLSRGIRGTPAFLPPLLLALSPLFYIQSMMAQLDMPAMVFTLLALLLFLNERYAASAMATVVLVLVKETGAVTPAVFFALLLWRRRGREAAYFLAAPLALGGWLVALHHATGYWMGNPGFEHYNVSYSLHPVRMALCVFRRIQYLLFAEFRWIATLCILLVWRRLWALRSPAWIAVGLVFAANLLLVTIFGGAALERYLLPVLPIFYIVAAFAIYLLPRRQKVVSAALLIAGLAASIFWNPPYPFPFENNFAMVDFVALQQAATHYLEDRLPASTVATAWPYSAALERPDYGFVSRPMRAIETNDFHFSSVRSIPQNRYNVLVVYTRTWDPEYGILRLSWIRRFLQRFYEYEPEITPSQCAELGLAPVISWQRRGQEITIYVRMRVMNQSPAIEKSASGDHAAIAAGS
jgi:4-amino-4-deoxy-L-arabinose transferase-like glycosyltransferase